MMLLPPRLARVLLLLAVCAGVNADTPCLDNDKDFRKQIEMGKIRGIETVFHACSSDVFKNMATSVTKPATPKPDENKFPKPRDEDDPLECGPYMNALVKWESRFSVEKLTDESPKTAWCGHNNKKGIGEFVMANPFKVKFGKPLQIWIGYGKSQRLYRENSRPKKIRLRIYELDEYSEGAATIEGHEAYRKVTEIGQAIVELADRNGFQTMDEKLLKRVRQRIAEGEVKAASVGIEILEVYEGSKYADVCISELKAGR